MEKMSFEEFTNKVKEDIKSFLPETYEDAIVNIHEITKNNDTRLTGITVTRPDVNISPTIYIDGMYEQYMNGKDFGLIMTNIAEIYEKNSLDHSMDVSSITDFEQAKDKIVARLVGAENNKELLSERPHTLVEDLAVTYHVMLGENDQGLMSVPITNQLMESYGISVDELNEIALKNMDALTPASLKSMNEVMYEMMLPNMLSECNGDKDMAEQMLSDLMPPDEGKMYVLTNDQKVNGAAEILNEKVMDKIAEQIGGDFYILPSSIHECIVVPKDAGLDQAELEQMVCDVNATQVAPEERLSDHVYAYDAKEHELYRADREEERAAAKEKAASRPKERASVKDRLASKQKEVDMQKSDIGSKDRFQKREEAIG